MRILVRRTGALGDVIMSTMVPRALLAAHPGATVDVETGCPAVYERHPDVTSVHLPGVADPGSYDLFIDLDMASERRRDVHQVDAYLDRALGAGAAAALPIGMKTVTLAVSPEPDLAIRDLLYDRLVVVHPNVSWRNRTLSAAWWARVERDLALRGWRVVVTGGPLDHTPTWPSVVDRRGELSLLQQLDLIARAAVFLCGDSGPHCLAGATRTPVVLLPTITPPELLATHRGGALGRWTTALYPDLACAGCSEAAGPVTYLGCARGDYLCVDSTPVGDAIRAVEAAAAGAADDGLLVVRTRAA